MLQATLFQSPLPDPLNVELVGQFPGPAGHVAVQGAYAYVTSWDADAQLPGLRIIDVSDPAAPFEASFYDTAEEVSDVAVAGTYAYLGDWSGGLRIIDVSDPANPSETGFCDTPGFFSEVALAGTYAYLADYTGLHIIDVSDPATPSEEGFYAMVSGRVAVMGSYAYLVDGGLRIIDVSNPTDPFEAGFYQIDSADDVAVAENYAYVASGFSGLRIIDVSTPTAPTETGFYTTYPAYAYRVTVAGSYAFVPYVFAEGGYALGILDVSDPSAPFEAGFYDYSARDVAVAGDYIYVGAGDGGLLILRYAWPERLYLPLVLQNW